LVYLALGFINEKIIYGNDPEARKKVVENSMKSYEILENNASTKFLGLSQPWR